MNILFVCTGNTCRSPMAEGYLESKNIDGLSVRSRGLAANGEDISENSKAVLAEIGIDMTDYISEPLTQSDLLWADKIYCMSLSHKTAVSMFASKDKVFVLGDGISDPFGSDLETYRKCRDEIINAIDLLIDEGEFEELYITKIEREHISQIAKLEKICFASPWSEEVLLDAYSRGTNFFVCVKGKKVLGYIGINCILDEGYITNIAVFPEYRGKGIGTALLNRVFSEASDLNLSFVSLEVRESNFSAISLYEKNGFKEAGRRPRFYSDPEETAIIMTKEF
ncbi:MAG: ribosomal protein S18-alanine N-acetyltransferase [Clostridia bacterium]|nr:ribosomal protein S18-alanine N-acetyltransferase [Clostridia bacterium]